MPITFSGIQSTTNDAVIISDYNQKFIDIVKLKQNQADIFGVTLTQLVDTLNTMSQQQLFDNNIEQIHKDLLAVKQHASSINIDINKYEKFISILNTVSSKVNIKALAKKTQSLETAQYNTSIPITQEKIIQNLEDMKWLGNPESQSHGRTIRYNVFIKCVKQLCINNLQDVGCLTDEQLLTGLKSVAQQQNFSIYPPIMDNPKHINNTKTQAAIQTLQQTFVNKFKQALREAATLDERPENMQITRAEVGALYQDNIGLTFKERSPENDKENLKFLIAKHLEKQGITVDVTDINVQSRRDNNGYNVTLPRKCLAPLNEIFTPQIIEDSEIIKKLKTTRDLDFDEYGQSSQGLGITRKYDVFIQCVKNLQINNLNDVTRLGDQRLLKELNILAQIKNFTTADKQNILTNFKKALNKATTLDERPTERHITSAEVGALYKNNAHLVILRARNPENDKKNLKDIIAKHLATQGITVDVTNINVQNRSDRNGYNVTLPHKCLEPLNNISSNNTPHTKNHL